MSEENQCPKCKSFNVKIDYGTPYQVGITGGAVDGVFECLDCGYKVEWRDEW